MARTTGRKVPEAVSRKRSSSTDDDDPDPKHAFPKKPKIEARTLPSRWRMKDDESRHTWHYLASDKAAKEWPQSLAEKYYLNLPLVRLLSPFMSMPGANSFQDLPALPHPKTPLESARNGLSFFEQLQLPSGHWGCEYGGPMFLLPGVVFTWYVTRTPIPSPYATAMKNYLSARANEDGGWGLHIEGETSAFGTSMNYAALRLMGVEAEDPLMVKARGALQKLGGALNAPHWTKFWFAVLGIMDWDVVNPVPPELWLLPDWVPIAPWRWWIHIRQVYLPMSYLYSQRWTCEETETIRDLRQELLIQPHAEIKWSAHRNDISDMDNYHPKSWVLNTANWFLVNIWNPYLRTNSIKTKAEQWTSELIDYEDANTDYSDLAPVNAPMNTVACYARDGPDAYSVRRHLERLEEALWVKDEGMLVNGTNGVQCWDTSFLVAAFCEADFHHEERWRPMLKKALAYLDNQQLRENVKDQDKCYRQTRKGGWPFSNKDQGYAVSDCTSEALKAVIKLQTTKGYPKLLDDRRIFDAVDTLLLYQNDTGACSSYENRRGSEWLELFNAAEVFGRIMVEYDYPECTTSCVTALSLFSKHWPDYRADDIALFIKRATNWIRANSLHISRGGNLGGWYGSWGICFTYATMFGLESLASVGEDYSTSDTARRACDYLLTKQREDGGWSESYRVSQSLCAIGRA